MTPKCAGAAAVLTLSLFGLAPSAAAAKDQAVGALGISGAWIRATPQGAATAAAYLTITNHGHASDRLMGASARGVESITPHSMTIIDGVMRMRDLPEGVAIPGGGKVTLAPGGDHLMLIGLKAAFRPGQHVILRLRFAGAGEGRVDFQVLTAAPETKDAMGGMKMP